MKKSKQIEALLWSIALPGFAQILNGNLFKGVLFIGLEFLVNVQANFNEVIILSFHGEIDHAIKQTDYQWLMFYPCLYMFAMWDAYRDAGAGKEPYSFFPFLFVAYFVTVGTIYSPILTIFGTRLGPVWLPILCVILGSLVGFLLIKIFRKKQRG